MLKVSAKEERKSVQWLTKQPSCIITLTVNGNKNKKIYLGLNKQGIQRLEKKRTGKGSQRGRNNYKKK